MKKSSRWRIGVHHRGSTPKHYSRALLLPIQCRLQIDVHTLVQGASTPSAVGLGHACWLVLSASSANVLSQPTGLSHTSSEQHGGTWQHETYFYARQIAMAMLGQSHAWLSFGQGAAVHPPADTHTSGWHRERPHRPAFNPGCWWS